MIGFTNISYCQLLTGHYTPGLYGLRSAFAFPKGFSYLNVTHMYYAAEMKDNHGNISTLAKPINVIANINGVAWGTRIEAIGADYTAALAIPLTNLAPNPETLELDPERVGIGDSYLIPALLSWNLDRIVVSFRYGVFLPVGSFSGSSKSNRGKGFWTHTLSPAVTLFIDKLKNWHASVNATYEIHSKQRDSDISPGQNLVVEWGAGKTFDAAFNMGIIGYNIVQTTKQTMPGSGKQDLNPYRLNGLGMEFGYRTKNRWAFATRWYLEYLAVNRPEGTAIRFVLMKNF